MYNNFDSALYKKIRYINKWQEKKSKFILKTKKKK